MNKSSINERRKYKDKDRKNTEILTTNNKGSSRRKGEVVALAMRRNRRIAKET